MEHGFQGVWHLPTLSMTSPCESRVGDATLAGPGGRKLGLRRVRRAKVRVGTAGPIFRGPRKGRADSRREFPPRAILKLVLYCTGYHTRVYTALQPSEYANSSQVYTSRQKNPPGFFLAGCIDLTNLEKGTKQGYPAIWTLFGGIDLTNQGTKQGYSPVQYFPPTFGDVSAYSYCTRVGRYRLSSIGLPASRDRVRKSGREDPSHENYGPDGT